MTTQFREGDRLSLFGGVGEVVGGARTQDGIAMLIAGGHEVTVTVLEASDPSVPLSGAQVWLLQELVDGQLSHGWTLMVDDPYWGVRVQPAEFSAAPGDETFVMGYRLRGRVLHGGQPTADANVSLELVQRCARDGDLTMWDSQEYNVLVYSPTLGTWVEGAEVRAPVRTGPDGRWSWIAPRGHGAAYQRAGDWIHGGADGDGLLPERYLAEVWACHEGRRAQVVEGVEATLDVNSAQLLVRGTPGAWLKVGAMDDTGSAHLVPSSGEVLLTGLAPAEYSVVQFRRTGGGDWDSTFGCPRVSVEVDEGAQAVVQMAPLEQYLPEDNMLAGRVYESPGVAAANVDVVALDLEEGEIAGVLARTDANGFWSVYVPPEGLGGQPIVHDPEWGTVPILGGPYSDIVLGARAYSGWTSETRAEPWRKGGYGHKNYPVDPACVAVEDAVTGTRYATAETRYGGWTTQEALPKYRFIADPAELLATGPELRTYNIRCGDEVMEAGFSLPSQPFEDWETPTGCYRAAGHFPAMKLLLGGKVHGNVLWDAPARVGTDLPEAARMGLEFGELRPGVEVRSGGHDGQLTGSALTGDLCPYCGAPAERQPGDGVATQGYCTQCAVAFSDPSAMDCRTHFRTVTGEPGRKRLRAGTPRQLRRAWQDVAYHWRPDHYDEVDAYVTQTGPGQRTNAPRWVAKHGDELAAPGLASFDGDLTPPFQAGHDLPYYSALPSVARDLGVAQAKIVFARGYRLPISVEVDVDCVLADGSQETRRIALAAGLKGPGPDDPFGDAVRLCTIPKLRAETLVSPYRGSGQYRGIADIRLVSPQSAPGVRFRIVCDVPFLASPLGVPVTRAASAPVALQLSGRWGDPHLACDGLGQIFALYTDDGEVRVHRRPGLLGEWDAGTVVGGDGLASQPWAGKGGSGGLQVVYQVEGMGTMAASSRNDGHELEG